MSEQFAAPLGAVWLPPVLRVDAVAKRWNGSAGLAPVSITIAPGEVVVVRGRSGAGKSTLLGLLAGWYLPDEGQIERAGEWAHADGWTTWRFTTVVPERPVSVPELTVMENVELVLRWSGVERSRRQPLVLHVLDRLGLVPIAGRLPRELTPGQRQRLSVACAVVGSVAGAVPTLVLADEPTSRQDHVHADQVLAVLGEVASAGAAVVIASDDPLVADIGRTVTLG